MQCNLKAPLGEERGFVLVIAVMLLLVLTFIGIQGITTTTIEINIAGNERVTDAVFYAAEAGIGIGIDQLPTTDAIPETRMSDAPGSTLYNTKYRSGHRTDTGPQPLYYLGMVNNPPGCDPKWQFKGYQINSTGTAERGATKEIEVQIRYGPFPAGSRYN